MRRPLDRIRHAVLFEAIAISLVTPLTAWVFDVSLEDSFVVTAVSALVAMAWNYLFNEGFDRALVRAGRSTYKTPLLRVVHATLFEIGLILMLVPFFMMWLDIGTGRALAMNLSLSVVYMAYAFAFNWAYDWLFPLPEWQTDT
ncbi:Bacterial Transmembrane Pair family protein [Roseivivax jejudonensis]|uniref:Bacterial Transmembrane Pair family protein n=1 Tax=Roseivivax jejudonensis TaxID=1529041 RepID=A0A1X7A129_9RHOB|nr:PACE efflux transporter [Roseivivax jejudonensis]SLN67672.1 Bacterial Transmembrane Pair family protein [Roseivivax jejudonensis]